MTWQNIIKQSFMVKTNFPDADIWLQTRGTEDNVGKPLKQFSPVQGKYNYGIKLPEGFNKDYVFKQLADLYRNGYWKINSYGTLNLQHIRKNDILKVLDELENKEDYKDETSEKFQAKKWVEKLQNEKFKSRIVELMDEEVVMKFDQRQGNAEDFYEEKE